MFSLEIHNFDPLFFERRKKKCLIIIIVPLYDELLGIIFQQMMEVIREGYSEINVHSKESECVGVDFIFFNYVNFI